MERKERIETETLRKTQFDRVRKSNSVGELIQQFEKHKIQEEGARPIKTQKVQTPSDPLVQPIGTTQLETVTTNPSEPNEKTSGPIKTQEDPTQKHLVQPIGTTQVEAVTTNPSEPNEKTPGSTKTQEESTREPIGKTEVEVVEAPVWDTQIEIVAAPTQKVIEEPVRTTPIEIVEEPHLAESSSSPIEVVVEATPIEVVAEPVRNHLVESSSGRIPLEVVEAPTQKTQIVLVEEPIRNHLVESATRTPIEVLAEPIRKDQIEVVPTKKLSKPSIESQPDGRNLLEPQGIATYTSDVQNVFQSQSMERDGLVGFAAPRRLGGAFKTRGMQVRDVGAAEAAPKNFVDVPDFGYYGIDGSLQTEF